MEGKIGRNDLCPCGSGKKYKRCCLDKGRPFAGKSFPEFFHEVTQRLIEKERVDAIPEFQKYQSIELVSVVSLLHVLPQNHGCNIRLEEIQRQAVKRCGFNETGSEIDIESFKDFVHHRFPSNHNEDPPENLFTQNLMTPMGNRILFPGISDGQVLFLQYLIQVLMHEEFNFPVEFKTKTLEAVFLLLNLSHAIATGLEYQRNMVLSETESNAIYFPPDEFIHMHKHLFAYTLDEIIALRASKAFDLEFLEDFILDPLSSELDSSHPDANPIVYKPLLRIDNTIVVVSPCTIVFAAVNFILKQAIDHRCLADLVNSYSLIGWSRIRYMLKDMGFFQIDFELPDVGRIPIREGIFVFDTDKFAYVIMKFDNGDRYDPKNPLGSFNVGYENELRERRARVYELMKHAAQFKDCKFFHLTIILGLGRPGQIAFESDQEDWEALGFSIDDLDILFKSDKCTNLTLWNFSKALNSRPLMTPFFLDNISFFINNDESFYASDDRVDNLMISVGNSYGLVVKSVIKYDEHLEVYPDKKLMLIQVRRQPMPALIPVYSTRDLPILPFRICCTSYDKPIWIRPFKEFKEPDNEHEKFIAEICIAIGYWLHELEILRGSFKMERTKPIVILVDAKSVSVSEMLNNIDEHQTLDSKIRYKLNDNEVHLILDEYFYFHLYRNDNFAERVLMTIVLQAIGSSLTENQITHQLSHDLIQQAIELHAPLGIKKKLLMQVSDYDIRISPHNVRTLRQLQPFQVNQQLDFLAEKIFGKNPRVRDITQKSEKLDVLRKVVSHFYDELRKVLKPYENGDLLTKLLVLYESSIQARERSKLETPPSLACFGAEESVSKELLETAKKRSQISLSLRCLIEHVAAEPVLGNKLLDSESLDSAVALMYNIINWGSISDQIYFEIQDTGISILASGRIGTDKSFESENMKPYYDAKFEEDIIDFSRIFTNRFSFKKGASSVSSKSIDTNFLEAFESEFQMGYLDFSLLVDEAVFFCYDSDECYVLVPEAELVASLSEKTKLAEGLIVNFLQDFALKSRGRVENVAELGFKSADYFPWRYGRGLSYLNRPFLALEQSGSNYIAYGCRSLIDFKYQLVSKIFAGSFHGTSKLMKSFTSKMLNRKGREFTKDVFELLKRVYSFDIIEKEQKIGPNGRILNPSLIGDIDVLIVNKNSKKVFLLECKNVIPAKTPYEMHLELRKFYDNKWFEKTDTRNEWLQNNMAKLAVYDATVDFSDFSLETIFVTNEVVPLPFIRKEIKYRFLTYNDLEYKLTYNDLEYKLGSLE